MIHYIKGEIQKIGQNYYITNPYYGIQVSYQGKQKKGEFFLIPILDDNTKTIHYFAFDNPEQKDFFRKITKINGVGNKIAFQLAQIPSKNLKEIVQNMKLEDLTQYPGIGEKTAKRVIIELKHEFSKDDLEKLSQSKSKLHKQIIGHLTSMGYNKDQVKNLLETYPKTISSKTMNQVITRLIKKI